MCIPYCIATENTSIDYIHNENIFYELSDDDTFGIRIRKLRKLNKLTCKKLGEISDIIPDSILQLERGVFNPTYTNILKLHKFFGDSIIVDNYSRYVLSNNNLKIIEWRKSNNIKYIKAAKEFNVAESSYSKIEKTTHITLRLYKTIEPTLKKLGIIP